MSNSEKYQREDVFWAPDPFKQSADPRPWLVIADEKLPYPGEEYICLSLTTSNLPKNHLVGDNWVSGRNSDVDSFCSPWVIATVKHDDVEAPQGPQCPYRAGHTCRSHLRPDAKRR